SSEPMPADAGLTALPLAPPRYALAIERMSIRPEPSPPDGPVAAPAAAATGACAAAGGGLSLASCARLLSENSTEFSLRSPRSLGPAAGCAALGLLPNRSLPSSSCRALADAAANRSPGSLRPGASSPNIEATASAPAPRPAAALAGAPDECD